MRWRTTVAQASHLALGLLCLACATEPRRVGVRLLAPEALSCRPTELSRVRVEPRGDFPAASRPSVSVVPGGPPVSVDRFAPETEQVLVFAEGLVRNAGGSVTPWVGGGRATLDARSETLVPLLPFGRACLLSDDSAETPEGSVALALGDGRLLVAGGHSDRGAVATVSLITPGAPLVDAASLRLFSPRTHAAAARLGPLVLVMGGAASAEGGALDAVETLRVAFGEESRVGQGFLQVARRGAAAVAVGDDTVLVVGGEDGGVALASAERVEVRDGGASVVAESLAGGAVARWDAQALVLDDGTVLVVGGRDASGPVGAVERYEAGELREVQSLAPIEGAAWVALPGARAARVSPDGEVEALLSRGEEVVALNPAPALASAAVAHDGAGRILQVGLDGAGRVAGFRVDPSGARAAERLEVDRLAAVIEPLADGSFALGDGERLALLRLDLFGALDDPPATIFAAQPDQRRFVVLDAPSRWAVSGGVLRAQLEGARWDLPISRFQDVRVTLDVEGAVELLLCADGAPCVSVELGADRMALGECTSDAAGGYVLERRGPTLLLGAVACPLPVDGRIGLGVRASADSGVRSLAVERL